MSRKVPLPLFLIVTLVAIVSIALHVGRTLLPLPFFDKGSAVFSVRDEKAEKVIVAIAARHGLRPHGRADGKIARRVILAPTATIINIPSRPADKKMAGAFVLRSRDPESSAQEAVRMLMDAGFEARLEPNPDPELPPNRMMFVRTNAASGWILGFRMDVSEMGATTPYQP